MAEKLKSISRQIHWSLLLKAAIFGLAWFFLPFWLFFLIAFYIYFVPFFQGHRFASPFAVIIILAFFEPPSIIFGFIFAALFYYLSLIKNLLLIDRKTAYEILIIILSFLLIRGFYERWGGSIGGASLWGAFFVAAILGILLDSFMRNFGGSSEVPQIEGARRISGWLSFVLFWQALMAGLFLPLDFIYQSIVVFLVGIVIIDLIPEHFFGGVSRSKIFMTAMTTFALLVLILASAVWKI